VFMRAIRQITALSALGLRTLPHRFGSSLVIVLGVAGVMAVLVSVLSMSASLIHMIVGSGRTDRVVVLQRGARSEGGSFLERAAILTKAHLACIRGPMASRSYRRKC